MIDTTLMDYGDYEVMLPRSTYCPGDFIRYVFAVPKDNMVGTNELDNAIKLLEFKNDEELEQHTVKKDFMEMVTGPFEFRFLPVWSDEEIAYSQSKGFLLTDIVNKKVEIHTISPGMYAGDIENVAVFDGAARIFVLEVLKSSGNGVADIWDEKTLKVIRFENDTFTVLAEHPAGIKTSAYTEPWFVYQKKIFIYNDSTTKLESFDENFKPVAHPLAETFNQNSKIFRRLQEFKIHPTIPFALVTEIGKEPDVSKLNNLSPEAKLKALEPLYDEAGRRTLFLYRWTEHDEKMRMTPLLSIAGSIWKSYNPEDNYSNFDFSPDGKWCVFRDHTGNSKNPVFVAVPINEKNPLLLGKPIKLGNAMRGDAIEPKSITWTTKPTAFIMCDGMLIYRWNLDRYKQLSMQKVKMPPGTADPFLKK